MKNIYNIEAEMAVLGAIINDPDKIYEIKEILLPQHFYETKHQLIYEVFLSLVHQKKIIDLVTIDHELKATNRLTEVGGMDYVAYLAESVSIAINALAYAKIVYDRFLFRETLKRATNITTNIENYSKADDLIDYAQKEIFELSKMIHTSDFIDWNELLRTTEKKIYELIKRDKNKITGLSTGYGDLDHYTNGLQPGELIILAARPSVGKTAFALNILKNVASSQLNNHASVAFFSLEMGSEQIMTRICSLQSGVEIAKIRTGDLNQEEQQQISYSFDKLKELNFHIDETPAIKINDLKSKARKLKVEHGLDLIVIDYLQLITTNNQNLSRHLEVSEISRELKALAKELNIPIIALSQLSRSVESRADKKPMMSDIRESGAIEQDADIIMMLYRPEYYGTNIEMDPMAQTYEGQTFLIINKNRNGATGELEFMFKKEINKFLTISPIE